MRIKEQVKHDQEISVLKGEVSTWKNKYNYAVKELALAEKRANHMSQLKQDFVAEKLKRIKPTGEATAICVWSDWHVEEPVDSSVVNGLNSFTLDDATKRAHNMFKRSLMCIDVARSLTTIDTLVIAALGDFISGYIHPELEEQNQLSPIEAIDFVSDLLVTGIQFMKKEGKFKNIIIPTCYGNHGRTQHKKRCSSGHSNSFEWGMYRNLAKNVQIPGVTWKVENGYHNWLDVQGYRVRFHHGDNIKYQGGIGGITIPVNKAISAWDKVQTASYDYFGHYHTFMNQNKWTCNGSLIGYNAYALSIKAEYEVPSQTFSIISNKRGKILTDRVFCD